MIGPGKYDLECRKALELAKATQGILLVLDGIWGSGFSARVTQETGAQIPAMLREVADQIEYDLKHKN